MDASTGPPRASTPAQFDTDSFKRKLLQKGVFPTPKIIHTLRKKHLQKAARKSKRLVARNPPPLSAAQKQTLAEEAHFKAVSREYRDFTRPAKTKTGDPRGSMTVGKPWEGLNRLRLRELAISSNEYSGEKLKAEHLRELGDFLGRRRGELQWLLDDDIEAEEERLDKESRRPARAKWRGSDADAIRFLIDKLSASDVTVKDWRLSKLMRQSGLPFSEGQLLKIVEGVGANGQWRNAMSIVQWVYSSKDRKHNRSRFVYTKLLAVLGRARRPREALRIFNLMRGDYEIYPDMPAYHSIAVTLGQAGLLKDLLNIIECMRCKLPKRITSMRYRKWDLLLEPDLVVFNAVLNACVPSHQWKGVFWVFEQLRKSGLKPNGASYGLAMEVMLHSGKYDLVYEFFKKMQISGAALKAITFKVLVRACWEEGKINEAVEAVRDMEQRGVIGTTSVYYELACCLSYHGRWKEAMMEVENLKKLPRAKQLAVTFTGMIKSALDGGHFHDCVSIFEQMKDHCDPNIGTINAMLKVYGQHEMFLKAKELFEETRTDTSPDTCVDSGNNLVPDAYTYSAMLEASASALQWEYFEFVYREMALCGHQLDQNKHGWLLVEASRAGKWHLLEHAFDTILDVGEIPHPSFFSEMVCQALAQDNCQRAVCLVNAMAYAPFQFSKEQWTDFFMKNEDRISRDGLQKLLDSLSNYDVEREATVVNLLASLHSLCGSIMLKGFSSSMSAGSEVMNKPLLDDRTVGFDSNNRVNTKGLLLKDMVGENLPVNNGSNTWNISVHTCIKTEDDGGDIDMEKGAGPSNNASKVERMTSLRTTGIFTENAASYEFTGHFDDRCSTSAVSRTSEYDCDEVELGMLNNEVDVQDGSKSPSVHEILEVWKESRKNDGFFFRSQLGQR